MSGKQYHDLISGITAELDDGMVILQLDEDQALILWRYVKNYGYDSDAMRGIQRVLFDVLSEE